MAHITIDGFKASVINHSTNRPKQEFKASCIAFTLIGTLSTLTRVQSLHNYNMKRRSIFQDRPFIHSTAVSRSIVLLYSFGLSTFSASISSPKTDQTFFDSFPLTAEKNSEVP